MCPQQATTGCHCFPAAVSLTTRFLISLDVILGLLVLVVRSLLLVTHHRTCENDEPFLPNCCFTGQSSFLLWSE